VIGHLPSQAERLSSEQASASSGPRPPKVEAAIAGTGIVRPHLDSGELEPVLEPWWLRFPGRSSITPAAASCPHRCGLRRFHQTRRD
jgi:hypothetical protein